MITDYEPFTFEKVLNSSELRENYGIYNNSSPEDYGFESSEISFTSLDGTKLNSWFIPSVTPSRSCLMLVHGRTSNRLKTMKYLALVDSLNLDTHYNIFIPDLRNSGKSQVTKTYMGYKFGEDVMASIQLMKREYHLDSITIFAFSMGAMATCNTLGRDDLTELLINEDVVIEKLILDSPLANVKETLWDQSSHVAFASIFFDDIFDMYTKEIDGFGEKMSISNLLPRNIPTLILQSKDDKLTLYSTLARELHQMTSYNKLRVVYFEGPGHGKMFQDKRTREKYINEVGIFLSEPSVHELKNK